MLHYETLDADDIRSIIEGGKSGGRSIHKWLSQKNSVRRLLPVPTGDQGGGAAGTGGGFKGVAPKPGGAGHKGGIDDLCG